MNARRQRKQNTEDDGRRLAWVMRVDCQIIVSISNHKDSNNDRETLRSTSTTNPISKKHNKYLSHCREYNEVP